MSKLEIEIKESEYLIKLQKGDFDLVQLKALLQQLLNLSNWEDPVDPTNFSIRRSAELMDRFDHLSDK